MLKKIKKLLIFTSLLLAVFALAHFVVAADFWNAGGSGISGDQFASDAGLAGAGLDLYSTIIKVIRWIIGFLGIIAVILIIYAGWLWMTAAGNEQKIEKAKKILIGALIGLILVIFSFVIASFILNSLTSIIGDGGNGDGSLCSPSCANPAPYCCQSACQAGPCSTPPVSSGAFIVASTIPGEGASSVIRNVVIRYNFNSNVNGATVNPNTFKVENITDNTIINGQTNLAGKRIEFVPLAGTCPANSCNADRCLPADKTIKVTAAANSLVNIGGLKLSCPTTINDPDSACVITFTTGDAIDCAKPTINIVDKGQACLDADNLFGFNSSDDSGVSSVSFNDNNGGSAFKNGPAPIIVNCLGSCTNWNVAVPPGAAIWRPTQALGYNPSTNYTITARADDFDSNTISDSITYNLRPAHCCSGVKDGNETGKDCGGSCGACDGEACALDKSLPSTTCSHSLCASQFCSPQIYGTTECEAAGYATGTENCCLCQSQPVITGIFPVGGFCRDETVNPPVNYNTACMADSDCTLPARCNITIPNGAVGNFVTIIGRNFGASEGKVYFKNGQAGGDWGGAAELANDINDKCTNSWSDTQIIAVVPPDADLGPVKIETAAGFSDDSTLNPALPEFLVNTISRPGICKLTPASGIINDLIAYDGIRLISGNQAYFGDLDQRVLAVSSTFPGASDKVGSALVPTIQPGKTTSFVADIDNRKVSSNYLQFTKDPEPYTGPFISSFEPVKGAVGQYVTIRGQGFGASKGTGATASQVYFGGVIDGNGNVSGGKVADFDFPKICADSIWSDKQVIVKVPDLTGVGFGNGYYNITMKIGSLKAINTDSLNPATFLFDEELPLAPSLCKIDPIMGQANTTETTLSGEYFGAPSSGKIKFQLNHDQSGGAITSWNVTVKPNEAKTKVHQQAVSGPVNVVQFKVGAGACNSDAQCESAHGKGWACRSSNGIKECQLVGNGMNFTVGVCQAKNDCGNAANAFCCAAGTPYSGQCKIGSDTQKACFPEYTSCVYEWNFSTGGSGVGAPCDAVITTPKCDTTPNQCSPGLVCDETSCTCQQAAISCTVNQTACAKDSAPAVTTDCCNTGESCNTLTGSCGLTVESCSGYGASQCSDSYFCPNSPGQCSTNPGGQLDTGVTCADSSCGKFAPCLKCSDNVSSCLGKKYNDPCGTAGNTCENSCLYNSTIKKCVKPVTVCYLPKNVEYTLSANTTKFTGSASCLLYKNNLNQDQYGWIMQVTTSCPTGWVNIGSNRCAISVLNNTTCSSDIICDSGFKCLPETNNAPSGVCAVDQPVCPAGSDCSAGKCLKDDKAGCECCCRKDSYTQDCCSTLKCEGTCGSDSGPNNNNKFGLCTGCTVKVNGVTDQAQSNAACNCLGTSGKFCDTSGAGGQGVCKDCAQISSAQNCSGWGVGVCCVDAKNNNSCRGGAIYATDDTTQKFCAYYSCGTGDKAATCLSGPADGKKSGDYKTTSCDNKCVFPPQFGAECVKEEVPPVAPTCDNSLCGNLSCLTDTGSTPLMPPCGVCCCDPNKTGSNPSDPATYDKCKATNTKFTCLANKGNCSGDNRGLCCGCTRDDDCGNGDVTGCGSDTCCQARPSVIATMPVDGSGNGTNANKVCRNALIKATFDQPMQISTFNGNIIVAGEYGGNPCPAGTEYLTAIYKPTIFAKIKSWLAKLPLVSKLLTKDAWALPQTALPGNFCAIRGTVSGYNTAGDKTVLEFRLQQVLEPSKKYYVIIKGDTNLTDAVKEGVLSSSGISLNPPAKDTSFNGKVIQGKIWSFTTLPDNAANSGICRVEYAAIEPASYLFQTNRDDAGDNAKTPFDDNTFDKIEDSDKLFVVDAYAADDTVLNPITGVYDWKWSWTSDNLNNIFTLPSTGNPATIDKKKQVVRTVSNATQGEAVIGAEASITGSLAVPEETVSATADVYLMVCDNPWPLPNANGTWWPWSDQQANCTTGDCSNTNFKVYYCRDAGQPGTADDLPVISNDAIVRGASSFLKCSDGSSAVCSLKDAPCNIKCSDGSSAVCTPISSTCGNGGKCEPGGQCIVDILKELYFFREVLPNVSGIELATITNDEIAQGGKAGLFWNAITPATGQTLDTYLVYYGRASTSLTQSVEAGLANGTDSDPFIISNLTNGVKYYFAVTAKYKSGAESPYSNVASAIPADSIKPITPRHIIYFPAASSVATLSWEADPIDSVRYKIYYGTASDALGIVVNVDKNKCTSANCVESIANLTPDRTYYFAVTGLDAAGNESAKSSTINITMSLSPASRRRADLLKIMTALFRYADSHGGSFPPNYINLFARQAQCLGVPTGEICWNGYAPLNYSWSGLMGSTQLMNDLTPYLSPIPFDPLYPRLVKNENPTLDKHWPADYEYNIGDAYLYFQGSTDFGCNPWIAGWVNGVVGGTLCQAGLTPGCVTVVNENLGVFLVWQGDKLNQNNDTICAPGRVACCGNGVTCGPKGSGSFYCALGIDKIYEHRPADGW